MQGARFTLAYNWEIPNHNHPVLGGPKVCLRNFEFTQCLKWSTTKITSSPKNISNLISQQKYKKRSMINYRLRKGKKTRWSTKTYWKPTKKNNGIQKAHLLLCMYQLPFPSFPQTAAFFPSIQVMSSSRSGSTDCLEKQGWSVWRMTW